MRTTNKAAKPADTPKRGRGRPPKELDIDLVKKLAEIQCTDQEIAAVCGVSIDTIARRKANPEFAQALEDGKLIGKQSLRRIQWNLAQTNASMAIFMGKNYLGQTDKTEQVIEQTARYVVEIPSETTPQDWQSTFRPNRTGVDDDTSD